MAKEFNLSDNEYNYLKNIGLNISVIRKKKEMSQADLAEKLNTARQNIYRIEAGKVNSTIIMFQRIASALDVSLEDLI